MLFINLNIIYLKNKNGENHTPQTFVTKFGMKEIFNLFVGKNGIGMDICEFENREQHAYDI